eukprot:9950856-Prorocentrum_lima.AAC.1
MRVPPQKFEPKAPNTSATSRDSTVTFGETSAALMNAAWGVVDLVCIAVASCIMATGDDGP